MFHNSSATTQQPEPGGHNPHEGGFFQEFTDDLDAFGTVNPGSVLASLA
jgi:hypothetical protein